MRVKSPGFTLIEVLVVLGIMGVLLAVGIPNYLDRASDQRTLAAARQLAADLRVAQREAVAQRMPVTVTFAASDAACPTGSASYASRLESTLLKLVCLPRDVRLEPAPLPRITFEALGTADYGITVRLRSARTAKTIRISVLPETGAVVNAPR